MANKAAARLPQINFPANDPLWAEVLELFKRPDQPLQRILAPHEFCTQLHQAEPLPWSYWNPVASYDAVILHKGRLEQLGADFLVDLQAYDYVYGNAVFLVYFRPSLNPDRHSGKQAHFSISESIARLKKNIKTALKPKPDSSRPTFLVVTANHCGNLGDDIITQAAANILKDRFPDAQIIIDFPPVSKKQLKGVDALFLGGGGLLYDNCFENAINYASYFLAAKELGIPAFTLGTGTQGINTQLGRELFKQALDHASLVMVRDNKCRQVLAEEVKCSAPITVKADTAFAMPLNGQARYTKKTNKPLLLYSLLDLARFSPAKIARQYQKIAEDCLPALMKNFEVVIVTQSRDDLPFYRKLQKKYNVPVLEPTYKEALDMLGLYKQADLVVTSRFHALIQSFLTACPVISVNSNGSKAQRLISNHLPSASDSYLWIREFSVASLLDKIDQYKKGQITLTPDPAEVQASRHAALSMMDEVEKVFNELWR